MKSLHDYRGELRAARRRVLRHRKDGPRSILYDLIMAPFENSDPEYDRLFDLYWQKREAWFFALRNHGKHDEQPQ